MQCGWDYDEINHSLHPTLVTLKPVPLVTLKPVLCTCTELLTWACKTNKCTNVRCYAVHVKNTAFRVVLHVVADKSASTITPLFDYEESDEDEGRSYLLYTHIMVEGIGVKTVISFLPDTGRIIEIKKTEHY